MPKFNNWNTNSINGFEHISVCNYNYSKPADSTTETKINDPHKKLSLTLVKF